MEGMSVRFRLGAAVLLAVVALAGCGGADPPADPPRETPAEVADPRPEQDAPAGGLTVEADPGGAPEFRPDALRADAGRATLELVNLSQTAHSLCVESTDRGALGCTGTFRGDRGTLRLRLEAGDYTFFCSVPGHREAGMHGKLVVQ
jgi:plastocyanin